MRKKEQLDEYGLTPQQRIFADELVLTGNRRASAIKAGVKPSSATTTAARMCANVRINTYITQKRGQVVQKLENDYGITRDDLLKELAAIARFDPRKMYDENGKLLPIHKMDEMTARAIASHEEKELMDEDGALIGYTHKLRRDSKIAAIELLGRHLRMWNDKDQGQGSILNIIIHKDKNLLDNPQPMKVIENGQG